MRVGLVLGAGGVVGASWLIGALEALESETGLDASNADVVVGSSSGAFVGTLSAAGARTEHLAGYLGGGSLDEVAEAEDRAADLASAVDVTAYRLQRGLPPIGPGSWRLALSTLRNPFKHSPGAVIGGWLPRGFVSTAPVRELVDHLTDGAWPDHPDLRIMATDYHDGRRVTFGADRAPTATISEAIAASAALPGFYHPVKVGGRRYIDGGICSMSNLDVVRGADLDAVVCLNPTSSLAAEGGGLSPVSRFMGLARAEAGRRLGREARKLRAEGTEVLLVQPSAQDLEVMGNNLMSRTRRVEVMEMARRSTGLDLRARRAEFDLVRRRRPSRSARPAPVVRSLRAA